MGMSPIICAFAKFDAKLQAKTYRGTLSRTASFGGIGEGKIVSSVGELGRVGRVVLGDFDVWASFVGCRQNRSSS